MSDAREKANPVFNTAKFTLFWLAYSGDELALRYASELGMDIEATAAAMPGFDDIRISSTVAQEHRFDTFNNIILGTGLTNVLDLACGYAPRAPIMAREGINYVGADLPAVISEVAPVVARACEGLPGSVAHMPVDITNYASLKAAADLLDGPLCIVTEGLFMYLTLTEKHTVCDNIRQLLADHGGCWLIQDNNAAEQYFAIAGVLWGKDALAHILKAKKLCDTKSDTSISANGYASEDEAIAAFAEAGLDVERIHFNIDGARLRCYDMVGGPMAEALATALAGCHAWKVTAREGAQATPPSKGARSVVKLSASGGVAYVRLEGRLDSLNSPELVELFETAAEETPEGTESSTPLTSAIVDMEGLEYISSAGLRVLLIMVKQLGPGSIAAINVAGPVREVLDSSGVSSLLAVE